MKYNLEVLNKLQDINEDKDIKALSHAIFPGTHCPLFGVALTASYIDDLYMLVVGTSECTYYTKNFSHNRQKGKDRVYSLVLKEKEVIFGAENKVKEACIEIYKREQPKGIMIVTTCVPELIGEDYNGLVNSIEEETGINIFVVSTEHYKCNSHIPGMKRALSSLITAMDKNEDKSGINILGHRDTFVENTELVKLLKNKGIEINTIIPSSCNLEEVKKATKGNLNIVTDMIAVELAEKMERKFNIPYIVFDKHMDKDIIKENYTKLQELLNIDLTRELKALEEEYNSLFKKASYILSEKAFIYGNTPMQAFETSEFLVKLGAVPKLIQVRELYNCDIPFKNKIKEKGLNPYITRVANIAPLRELYGEIGACIYIGHESPMLLKSKGLSQLTFDEHGQKIGYELPIGIMKTLIDRLG
ncbi:MAG: nitrogenase component 1 [Clostridium sp.]